MDIRPKRRKFKDNPYVLESVKEKGLFYIIFKNNKGVNRINVTEEIFNIFDESERYENSKLKEYSVHIEHSEQSESSLSTKGLLISKSIEELTIENIIIKELWNTINKLPTIQRKRLIKYYFYDKTLKEISLLENCSINAIKHSIDRALNKIYKELKNIYE